MEVNGFTAGTSSACVYHHPAKDIIAVIHGDDFTLLGFAGDFDWFRQQIVKKFEVNMRGRLGPAVDDENNSNLEACSNMDGEGNMK